MPWVAQDDHFFTNPKARSIGPLGRELFSASWCWCSQQRNDGVFVAEDVPVIAALAQVEPSLADLLVSHGMWHLEGSDCAKCRAVGQVMPVPSGHVAVHEYLKQNKSRAEILAAEERARNAALARHASSSASSTASGSASRKAKRTALPSHPIGDSSRRQSRVPLQAEAPPRPDDDELSTANGQHPPFPGEVWALYADRKHQRQPGKVRNPIAWKLTTAENARLEHGEQAAGWWNEFDCTPAQLADWILDGRPHPSAQRRPGIEVPPEPWPTNGERP